MTETIANYLSVSGDTFISLLSTGSEDYPEILQVSGALDIETNGGLATSDLRTIYLFDQDYKFGNGIGLNITDKFLGDIGPEDRVSDNPSVIFHYLESSSGKEVRWIKGEQIHPLEQQQYSEVIDYIEEWGEGSDFNKFQTGRGDEINAFGGPSLGVGGAAHPPEAPDTISTQGSTRLDKVRNTFNTI